MIQLKQRNVSSLNCNKKGFTLVEIMVAILMTTIVLTAAYMIWSRVRLGISRSNTKQILQSELRKAANFLQNDLKSIKYHDKDDDKDPDKDKAFDVSADENSFTMKFEKFKEIKEEDKAIGQDFVEDITYTWSSSNKILKREVQGGGTGKILSTHCESIDVNYLGDEPNNNGNNGNNANDSDEYKEAKLEIEIIGKMIVPGSTEEMYHTEKTSVVMRNEYYKKTYKNYKSVFDLASRVDKEESVGAEADGMLTGDLTKDQLAKMPKDVLENLKASEQESLQNAMDNLKQLNDTIGNIKADGVNLLEQGWHNFTAIFTGGNDYTDFTNARSKLEKADSVADVKKVVEKIKQNVQKQEDTFYKQAYPNYDSLSAKDKVTFKKAYDMAVHDKTVSDAYEETKKKAKEGEDVGKKPISYKEIQECIRDGKTLDSDGNKVDMPADQINAKSQEDAKEVLKFYNKIDLGFMKDGDDDIGIYKANKTLLEEADTKIEILNVREKCKENINNINDVLDTSK